MALTNYNTSPYYDDFDPTKNYNRILFRPGMAVQARELTQSQTILQDQIAKFGNNIFKEGAMVQPGSICLDTDLSYVKVINLSLGNTYQSIDPVTQGEDVYLLGVTSGIKAKVITTTPVDGAIPVTAFIKYVNSGTLGTYKTFIAGEEIQKIVGNLSPAAFATCDSWGSDVIRKGSAVTIDDGVYYIRGTFVNVLKQTLILDKYTNTPSYKIGLDVVETVVTSSSDSSLLDNAYGSPNYAAPGADRYKITLTLAKKALSSVTNEDFIELMQVQNGIKLKHVVHTEYSILEDTLARQKYDESGDYYLKPFQIELKENPNDSTKFIAALDPSKAYVRGYEIQTIATTDIDVNKARDYQAINNGAILAGLGNWVYVTGTVGFPDTSSFKTIDLKDNADVTIGTANMRNFEAAVIAGQTITDLYKAYLFNIVLDAGKQFSDVTSYQSSVVIGTYTNDVTGYICSEHYITGAAGLFSPTDIIKSKSNSSLKESVIVWNPATNLLITSPEINAAVFGGITANTIIDLYSNADVLRTESAGKTSAVTKIFDTGNNCLIHKLPNKNIKTATGTGGASDTTYTVRRVFRSIQITNTNEVQLTVVPNLESFESSLTSDYCVTGVIGGVIVKTYAVTNVNLLSSTAVTLTIDLDGTTPDRVNAIGPVTKLIAANRSKKLNTFESGATSTVANGIIQLSYTDIFSLEYVLKNSDDSDITSYFTLDNGQRDTHYQYGKLIVNDINAVPNGTVVKLKYKYFSHSASGNNAGDYFSVDSYNPAELTYSEIPSYTSTDTKQTYNLRDCLDFRPDATNSGTTTFEFLEILKPNSIIRADYSYYLPRIDKLYLSKEGDFHIVQGVSADNPKYPEDPRDGMVLYVLHIPAYTFSATDVTAIMLDNRRYTMRDIGKLENRIENLEYYTTLSLLEKQTANLEITDYATGLSRYKNGFIVDSFVGHGIGDVYDSDYKCSIDPNLGKMRPLFRQDSVELILNTTNSSDYTKSGDLITLPFTHTKLIDQPYASQTVNINPYNIFTWIGNIKLNPETDTWRDVDQKPSITIQDNTTFDAIRNSSDNQTVLGTVWGEWKTNWVGTTYEGDAPPFIDTGAVDDSGHRIQSRAAYTQTVTTSENQTRTAVVTTIVPGAVKNVIDNKIIQVGLIPIMRSRNVLFNLSLFKPSTRLYAFFDKVSISDYITGECGSGYSSITPPTLTVTGAAIRNATVNVIMSDDGTKIRGFDIVDGGAGYTTATLNWTHNGGSLGTTTLQTKIVDGALVAISQPVITTDSQGIASGSFIIPNNSELNFKTGSRMVRFTDDSVNGTTPGTWGEIPYQASGILETKQATISSTREPQVVRNTITETRVITNTATSNSSAVTQWIDPLAQSFLVDTAGGIFVSKIDVYFATKDQTIPVTLQIRNTVNGYPGQQIVPFSNITLYPASVNVDPTGTANTATTFIPESPIYLQDKTEYALVLLANSNNYTVWTAQLGAKQIGTTDTISQQPYAGVLFKSQNGSTWSAEQMEDLKFSIYRATFDTTKTAIVTFTNDAVSSIRVTAYSIKTTNASNYVRVYRENHGQIPGGTVTVSGLTDDVNGIPKEELNTAHTIIESDSKSFVVQVTTPATSSGYGGSQCVITHNIFMDACHPIVQNLILPGTNITSKLKTTTGKSFESATQIPWSKDTNETATNIILNETLEFPNTKIVADYTNETAKISGITEFDRKSVVLISSLTSTVDNLSPVIDVQRTNLIVIGNKIAQPEHTKTNFSTDKTFDRIQVGVNACDYTITNLNTITFSAGIGVEYINSNLIGKYISLNDTNFTHYYDNAVKVIDVFSPNVIVVDAELTNGSSTGKTLSIFTNYIGEESPSLGSSPSKYITRALTIQNPANALKVYVTAFRTNDCDFDVYYKIGKTTDYRPFSEIPYVLASLETTPINNIGKFVEYQYEIDDLDDFSTFAIKIVPKSTNTAQVPQFEDIRAIAHSA